jgi:hypothetical protein
MALPRQKCWGGDLSLDSGPRSGNIAPVNPETTRLRGVACALSVRHQSVQVLAQMKLRRPRAMFVLWFIVVILLPAFNFSASATSATLVYSSFGPGSTYNSGADWIVGGSASLHGYQGHAEYFVPGFSGYLSQIQVGTKVLGGVALSDFFIAQDNGSGIPGAVLENFSNVSDPNGVLTLNSVTTPLLQAGQKYWLCDEPADPNTYTGWCLNSRSITNGYATETSQGGWFALASSPVASCVFSISAVPVPEPSTAGLVFVGAGLLEAERRGTSRRRVRQK